MTITYKQENIFKIKTKKVEAQLDKVLKIGDFEISNPGEYEVAGIECLSYGKGLYYLVCEDIRIAYFATSAKVSEKQIENFTNIDVVIAPANEIKEIANELEPKIIIPWDGDLTKFCQNNKCEEPIDTLKIKKSSLDEESRIVVLTARK